MNNAKDTVKAPTRSLKLILAAGLSALVLTACGGGAQTTDNPITSVTPPSTYNGPPPATADVQAFKLNVWDNIQADNRCGGCHTDGVGAFTVTRSHRWSPRSKRAIA